MEPPHDLAFPCSLSPFFSNITISFESFTLCQYVRYHLIIFLLFGSLSVFLMCMALALVACYGSDPTREQACRLQRCVRWALGTLVLSLGFEFALFVVYVACFVCVWVSVVRFILLELAWVDDGAAAGPGLSAHAVTISDGGGGGSNCPICLDSLNSGGLVHTTPCGHTFHVCCIAKWQRGTCPMCRQVVGVRN